MRSSLQMAEQKERLEAPDYLKTNYFLRAAIIFFMAAFFNLGSFFAAFDGRPVLDP